MEGTPGLRSEVERVHGKERRLKNGIPFVCCYKDLEEVFHIPCTIRPSTRHHGALRSEMDKGVQISVIAKSASYNNYSVFLKLLLKVCS